MGVGGGRTTVVALVRLGSVARSWVLRAFIVVVLTTKIENININCELGCKGELMPKNLSLSILRRVTFA